LERKVGLYPNTRAATFGGRYFVRRKPTARNEAHGWYSLHDLCALGTPC
jgi:hypothetical protein